MRRTSVYSAFILSLFLLCMLLAPAPLLAARGPAGGRLPETESAGADRAKYWINDLADLFTPEQEQEIESKLKAVIDHFPDVALAVMTTPDTGGKKIRSYGEDLFEAEDLGYGPDFNGVFIVIEMSQPSFYIGTYGKAIKILTDQRIENIIETMKPDLKAKNYSTAVIKGLESIEYYEEQGIPAGQHEYKENVIFTPVRLIVSLAIFAVVSLAAAFGFRKSVQLDYDKYTKRPFYDVTGQAQEVLAVNTDNLIDRQTRRYYNPVPKQSSSDSGRSTTHTTGGGRSSGGGGSSF